MVPGVVIGPGGEATYKKAPTAEAGHKVGVYLGRGRESGGGFETMETYICRSHNTSAQYIVTLLIMDLCEASERKQEERVGVWWW